MTPYADRRAFLDAALSFADASRRVILRRVRRGFRARLKRDGTPVTEADLEAEKVLRSAILRRFPEHGIVGEELPDVRLGAAFRWYLDPIDGTMNFSRGIPLYGTILALHRGPEPLVGVLDFPGLGRRYWAAKGLGAWRDGIRLRNRDLPGSRPVEEELVAVGARAQFERQGALGAFDSVVTRLSQARIMTDCFAHALAAEGALGGMADFGIKIWDLAATQVLAEEAGGRYVVARKRERPGHPTLYGIVFGKPRVVSWLSRVFR